MTYDLKLKKSQNNLQVISPVAIPSYVSSATSCLLANESFQSSTTFEASAPKV